MADNAIADLIKLIDVAKGLLVIDDAGKGRAGTTEQRKRTGLTKERLRQLAAKKSDKLAKRDNVLAALLQVYEMLRKPQ